MRPLLPLLLWPQALAEVRTCNPSAPGGRGTCLTSITGCSFLIMLSYRVVPEGIGLMMCFLSFAARSRKSKLSPPWHFQTVVAKRMQNDETIYSVWKYTRQKDQDMQIQDTVASLHVLNHFQQCKHATMSNIRNHWMEAKPSSWWGDWLEAVHDWWITTRREKL